MRRTRNPLIASLLLLCPVWLASGGSIHWTATSGKCGVREQLPRAAPDFTLHDLRDRRITAADLKGSIVVLDFWATWCEPCIGEIPDFNRLQEKYRAQGVKVIGLTVQSGLPRDIRRFANKYDMKYTILAGTDETVADFDVISFPTTFLITADWRIYRRYTGAYEGKDAEIVRDIETLLGARQTPVKED